MDTLDTDKMSKSFAALYQHSTKLKEKQLVLYDANTGVGYHTEVIKHHSVNRKDSNQFMIKDDFKLFNNPLTVDPANLPQDHKFIL